MMRSASLLLVALVASCNMFDAGPAISMASQTSTLLSLDDTLVIRRTISSGEADTVWLDISSMAVPYRASNVLDETVCYQDTFTAEGRALPVAHGESVTHERKFVLRQLEACEPGVYEMEVVATLYTRPNFRSSHAVHLKARAPRLTVTAP
jgi:hypothetical protein